MEPDSQSDLKSPENILPLALFQDFINALPDATLIVNEHYQVVFANLQVTAKFGYSSGELAGVDIEKLMPERYRTSHLHRRQGYLAAPVVRPMSVNSSIYGLRKDGTEFPVDITLSPFETAQGPMIICSIRDITVLTQAEKSLINDERFQLFMHYVPAAVAMFDKDLRYLAVSQRWLEDYQVNEQDIVGRCHYDIFSESSERWKGIHRRCLSGEVIRSEEELFLRTDGRLDWVQWSMCPWYSNDSKIGGTILFTEVVTKRKQAEINLHKSGEHFRKIFENAIAGIAIKDMSGKFQHCNAAYCDLLGYNIEELRQIGFSSLVHPDDLETVMAKIHQLQAGQVPHFEIENRYVRKNGESVWVRKYVSTLPDEYGKCAQLLTIAIDITELKRTEKALQANHQQLERQIEERTHELDNARRQAEQANATKTRFLTAASHDLRQPLQSAELYLSLLSHHLDSSKYRQICDAMHESLIMMGSILDSLLDISRLESGSITPSKKDFFLRDLFDRIVKNTVLQAEAKGLKITYQKNDCIIYSDPALLERIIENFVANAIRYTEEGQIILDCEYGIDDTARISVKDTGLGIPSNELEHIFDEYYQLNNPERERGKGLGLGLAIVKHIASILEHPLDVWSSPGQGSVFTIQVPLGQAMQLEGRTRTLSAALRNSRLRSPAVFFIDDDPVISKAMQMFFEVNGVESHFARSGEAAFARIEAGVRPDMVISDYQLPGCNGIETICRIRKLTHPGLPAVLITGDTSVQPVLDENSRDYIVLHKPVDPQRLLALIADAAKALSRE